MMRYYSGSKYRAGLLLICIVGCQLVCHSIHLEKYFPQSCGTLGKPTESKALELSSWRLGNLQM